MQEMQESLGWCPRGGNGNPLFQYSCLEICMGRGTWWSTVHGVTESWTKLSNWVHTSTFCTGHYNTSQTLAMGSKLICKLIPNSQMDSSRQVCRVERYQKKFWLTINNLHYDLRQTPPPPWSPVSSLHAAPAAENKMILGIWNSGRGDFYSS